MPVSYMETYQLLLKSKVKSVPLTESVQSMVNCRKIILKKVFNTLFKLLFHIYIKLSDQFSFFAYLTIFSSSVFVIPYFIYLKKKICKPFPKRCFRSICPILVNSISQEYKKAVSSNYVLCITVTSCFKTHIMKKT